MTDPYEEDRMRQIACRRSEDVWEPAPEPAPEHEDEPEDELSFFTGLANALGMTALMVIMIWCGIAWFAPDPFHEPLVGEIAP